MATPHVAGAAALAWSVVPGATYSQVRQAIFDGVDNLPALDASQGSNTPVLTGGRLNAVNTLGKLAMVVTESTPASGSVYYASPAPTTFGVHFSYPVASVASDKLLKVNQIAADFATISKLPDGQNGQDVTYTFTSANPVGAEGTYTMSLDPEAVTASAGPLGGTLSKAWSANFTYTLMHVLSAVPPNPILPMTSLTVTFSENYDSTTVDTTDLILDHGSVESVTLQGDRSVRYNLSGIVSDGTLTVQMLAGAVKAGTGAPMAYYSTSFDLDYGDAANPTPLLAVAPLSAVAPAGGLIYRSTVSGTISPAGDTDNFTIAVDPGQTIGVAVDPATGLTPTVTLKDPNSGITSASATNPGQGVVLQPVGTTTAGMYTISVASVNHASSGAYTLQVVLNAALEGESHGGPANDGADSVPQDIGGSFIAVTSAGSAQRGAVLGKATGVPNPAAADSTKEGFDTTSLTPYTSVAASDLRVTATALHDVPYGLEGAGPSGLDGWIYRDDAQVQVQPGQLISAWVRSPGNVGGRAYFGFAATSAGTYSLVMAPNTGQFLLQRNVNYGYTDLAAAKQTWLADHWYRMEVGWAVGGSMTARLYDSDGATLLNTVTATDTTYTSGGIAFRVFGGTKDFDTVQVVPINTSYYLVNPNVYSFGLAAGQSATLAFKTLGLGTLHVDLIDDGGNVLTSGTAGNTNVSEAIQIPAVLADTTCYARISGSMASEYSLVVTRGADFDLEPNSGPAPWNGSGLAQTIGANSTVLGHAVSSGETFEEGNLNDFTGPGMSTATVTTAAAHDGSYGLATTNVGTDWIYRDDDGVHVQRGDVISVWVRTAVSPNTQRVAGRAYFGFGATAAGTYSLQMAPNTSQFILGLNQSYGFANLAVASQTWLPDYWYRMEV